MIGLLLNAIVFLIPALIYLFAQDGIGKSNALAMFLTIAVIYLITNIGVFCSAVHKQINDIEEIGEKKGTKLIYEKQRDELISQATLYLGEKYPEHEKELFKLIAEKNSEAVVNLLGAFPEIKTADMLKTLVGKIEKLHGNVYYQDTEIEKLKRKIRVRKRNPYMIKYLLPIC